MSTNPVSAVKLHLKLFNYKYNINNLHTHKQHYTSSNQQTKHTLHNQKSTQYKRQNSQQHPRPRTTNGHNPYQQTHHSFQSIHNTTRSPHYATLDTDITDNKDHQHTRFHLHKWCECTLNTLVLIHWWFQRDIDLQHHQQLWNI